MILVGEYRCISILYFECVWGVIWPNSHDIVQHNHGSIQVFKVLCADNLCICSKCLIQFLVIVSPFKINSPMSVHNIKIMHLDPISIYKTTFLGMGIPMWKIRQLRDRFIFNIEIPILERWHLYIESPTTTTTHSPSSNYFQDHLSLRIIFTSRYWAITISNLQ